MFQGLNFEPVVLPETADALRKEVRAFLDEETGWFPNSDFNTGASAEFSQ